MEQEQQKRSPAPGFVEQLIPGAEHGLLLWPFLSCGTEHKPCSCCLARHSAGKPKHPAESSQALMGQALGARWKILLGRCERFPPRQVGLLAHTSKVTNSRCKNPTPVPMFDCKALGIASQLCC